LSFASRSGWRDWYCLLVGDPFSILISGPGSFLVFVSKTTVMPVASIPRPSSRGEAALGWAPVSPFLSVMRPLIPDLKR